jgi:hypothetical protein
MSSTVVVEAYRLQNTKPLQPTSTFSGPLQKIELAREDLNSLENFAQNG